MLILMTLKLTLNLLCSPVPQPSASISLVLNHHDQVDLLILIILNGHSNQAPVSIARLPVELVVTDRTLCVGMKRDAIRKLYLAISFSRKCLFVWWQPFISAPALQDSFREHMGPRPLKS